MSDELKVITNHQPRPVLDAYELSTPERAEFDYLDWAKLEAGDSSASFIRYRGVTYDLGEFGTTSGLPEFNPLKQWDGYISDTFFSGVVVRFVDDGDSVIVGTFYA